MNNTLRAAFGFAAMGIGAAGAVISAIGLYRGEWETMMRSTAPGSDLTEVGVASTAVFAAVGYAGLKAYRKALEGPK